MGNHSYENDFNWHENETACRTHFHKNGFTLRLVLKQRHENSEMAYYHCLSIEAPIMVSKDCSITGEHGIIFVRLL